MKLQQYLILLAGLCLTCQCTIAQSKPQDTGLELKKSAGTLMQYYVSLPEGWSPDKKWPVVVICEEAEKAFKENTLRFIKARGKMPFIIISPVIVTNGNYGRRNAAIYPYTTQTWDAIDAMSDCKFDVDGLVQIVNDVQKNYNGESHFYITGFEAGTHLVWAMIFEHPELLKAAAPVAGNYISRCVNTVSADAAKATLPVMGFVGDGDKDWGAASRLYGQWQTARKQAIDNGYKNISETVVKGKGHVPMPDETLAYFYSLYKKG